MIKKVIVNNDDVVSIDNLNSDKYYMYMSMSEVWFITLISKNKTFQSICLTHPTYFSSDKESLSDTIKNLIDDEILVYEFDSIMEGMNFFIKDNLKNIS